MSIFFQREILLADYSALNSQNMFSSTLKTTAMRKSVDFNRPINGEVKISPSKMLGSLSVKHFENFITSDKAPSFSLLDQRSFDAILWKKGEVFIQLEDPLNDSGMFISHNSYPSVGAALMHTPIAPVKKISFIHKDSAETVSSAQHQRHYLPRGKIMEIHAAGLNAMASKALNLKKERFIATHETHQDLFPFTSIVRFDSSSTNDSGLGSSASDSGTLSQNKKLGHPYVGTDREPLLTQRIDNEYYEDGNFPDINTAFPHDSDDEIFEVYTPVKPHSFV